LELRQMGTHTQGVPTEWKKSFLDWFAGSFVPVQEIFVLHGFSSRPSQNIFSSPDIISHQLPPSPSKLGRQSCRAAYLFNKCLWMCLSIITSPGADPPPFPLSAAKAGRNRLNEWNTHFFPTGERYSHTIYIYVKQRSCADVNSPCVN
jgi:hypothetical protein